MNTAQKNSCRASLMRRSRRILHGWDGLPQCLGELAHIQNRAGQAKWLCFPLNNFQVEPAMSAMMNATRALNRQKIAVERTLYARSAEESQLAARWAAAWHKLVQRKLDNLATRSAPRVDFSGFLVNPPSRVLH
ncbi:hypothetical protein [Duganella sp. Leaf61]|uniref:hypothetical protein n=1 Tax=Duganella sp. Leaf61 TaxID=1736227 RepID=UPI001E5FF8A9|nr:hypothetical protein [Duganella sp. Leaf61]